MKLSELIREGSKLYPQAKGSYFEHDHDDKIVRTCAIGSAILAWRGTEIERNENPGIVLKNLLGYCGIDENKLVNCRPVYSAILWWNDNGWTREQIADELEKIGL